MPGDKDNKKPSQLEELQNTLKLEIDRTTETRQHIPMALGTKPKIWTDSPVFISKKLLESDSVTVTDANGAPVPEDLFVAAALGAMFDPEVLRYCHGADVGMSERGYLMDGIFGIDPVPRHQNYMRALYEARNRAKEAIEAYYNKGESSLLNRYLGNVGDFVNTEISGKTAINSSHQADPEYKVLKLCEGLKKTEFGDALKLSGNAEKNMSLSLKLSDRMFGMQKELYKIVQNPDNGTINKRIRDEAVLNYMALKQFLIMLDRESTAVVPNRYEEKYAAELLAGTEAAGKKEDLDPFTRSVLLPLVPNNLRNRKKGSFSTGNLNTVAFPSLALATQMGVQQYAYLADNIYKDILANDASFSAAIGKIKDKIRSEGATYKKIAAVGEADTETFAGLVNGIIGLSNPEKLEKEEKPAEAEKNGNAPVNANKEEKGPKPKKITNIDIKPEDVLSEEELEKREAYIKKIIDEPDKQLKENISNQRKRSAVEHMKQYLQTALKNERGNVTDSNGRKPMDSLKAKLEELGLESAVCYDENGSSLKEESVEQRILSETEFYATTSKGLRRIRPVYSDVQDKEQFRLDIEAAEALPTREFHYNSMIGTDRFNMQYAISAPDSSPDFSKVKSGFPSILKTLRAANAEFLKKPAGQAGEPSDESSYSYQNRINAYNRVLEKMEALYTVVNDQYSREDTSKDGNLKVLAAYNALFDEFRAYGSLDPFNEAFRQVGELMEQDLAALTKMEFDKGNISYSEAMGRSLKHQQSLPEKTKELEQDTLNIDKIREVLENRIDDFLFNKQKNIEFEKMANGAVKGYENRKYEETDPDMYTKLYGQLKADLDSGTDEYRMRNRGEFNEESYIEFLRNIKPDYKIPEALDRRERKIISDSTFKAVHDAMVRHTLEERIAFSGIPMDEIPRNLRAFVKSVGTEEARKENREFARLLAPGEGQNLKEAYTAVLKEIDAMDLSAFDFTDDKIFVRDPQRVIDFITKTIDINGILKDARRAQVPLDEPEFDSLRKKSGAIENIASMLIYKLGLITSPAYELFEHEQFIGLADEVFEAGALEISPESHIAADYNNLAQYRGQLMQSGYRTGMTYEDWLKDTDRVSKRNEAIDPGDSEIMNLRESLVKDVKTYFGIGSEATKRYKDVIQAIDDYRSATLGLREEARQNVVQKCDDYIDHRRESAKRTGLVHDVKEKFTELESTTKRLQKPKADIPAAVREQNVPEGNNPVQDPNGVVPEGNNMVQNPEGAVPEAENAAQGPNGAVPEAENVVQGPNGAVPEAGNAVQDPNAVVRNPNEPAVNEAAEETPELKALYDSVSRTREAVKERLNSYLNATVGESILGSEHVKESLRRTNITTTSFNGPLKDTMMRALTLGALLDDDLLKQCNMQSSTILPEKEAKQDFLIGNVLLQNDHTSRRDEFDLAVIEGRKNAAKAFQAYDNHRPMQLKKYAENFIKYMGSTAARHDLGNSEEGCMYSELFELYDAVKTREPFSEYKLSKFSEHRITEKRRAHEFLLAGNAALGELAKKVPAAGSEERKAKLKPILANYAAFGLVNNYVQEEVTARIEKFVRENNFDSQQNQDKVFTEILNEKEFAGVTLNSNDRLTIWTRATQRTSLSLQMNYRDSGISYVTYMMVDESRRKRFLKAIEDLISRSLTLPEMNAERSTQMLGDKLQTFLISPIGHRNINLPGMDRRSFPLDFNCLAISEEDKRQFTELNKRLNGISMDNLVQAYRDGVKEEIRKDIREKVLDKRLKQDIQAGLASNHLTGTSVGQLILDQNLEYRKLSDLATPGTVLYVYTEPQRELVKLTSEKDAAGNIDTFRISMQPVDGILNAQASTPILRQRLRIFYGKKAELKPKTDAYTLESLARVKSVSGLLKAAGTADPEFVGEADYREMTGKLDAFNELIEKQYIREEYVHYGKTKYRYPEMTGEQWTMLMQKGEEALEAVNHYCELLPDDRLAKQLQDSLKTGMKELRENVKLTQGREALAEKIYQNRTGAVEEQKQLAERQHFTAPDAYDITTNLFSQGTEVLKYNYIMKRPDIFRNPSNGLVKTEDDCLFDRDGQKITPERMGELLSANYNDAVEMLKKDMPDYYKNVRESEITNDQDKVDLKEQLLDNIKEYNPEYRVPEEQEEERENFSRQVYEKVCDYMARSAVEKSIVSYDRQLSTVRELSNYADSSGTPEGRAFNREYAEAVLSGNNKKAYTMCLDRFLEHYRELKKTFLFTSDIQFLTDTDRMIECAMWFPTIQNLTEDARKAGVDFSDPKYEELRTEAPFIYDLGTTLNGQLKHIIHLSYRYLDMRQIQNAPEGITDETGNQMADAALGQLYFDHKVTGNRTLELMTGKRTLEQTIALCRVSAKNELDEPNARLVTLRNKLVNDVKTIGGFRRESSQLYKDVVEAIDNYRKAGWYDKEDRRSDIVKACETYLQRRGTGKKRSDLVENVLTEVKGLEKHALKCRANVLRNRAGYLLNGYKDYMTRVKQMAEKQQENVRIRLEKEKNAAKRTGLKDALLTQEGRVKACETILNNLENPEKQEVLIEQLKKSSVCLKMARNEKGAVNPNPTTKEQKEAFNLACVSAVTKACGQLAEGKEYVYDPNTIGLKEKNFAGLANRPDVEQAKGDDLLDLLNRIK